MGKFNKKPASSLDDSSADSESIGFSWQELMSKFEMLSVEDALRNIMQQLMSSENVEFDQLCLILKHYLLLADKKSYLEHFINFDSNVYVNLLIDRFNASSHSPNTQWMITEIFKVLTTVCDSAQVQTLLQCQKFQSMLYSSLFVSEILDRLRVPKAMSNTEVAIVINLFETISNLCEVSSALVGFVTPAHIDWISTALLIRNIQKDLVISLTRLIHMFSEKAEPDSNNNSSEMNNMLLDLFVNKSFLVNALTHLNISQNADGQETDSAVNNLTAKLYLIDSFVNCVTLMGESTTFTFDKGDTLLKMFEEYGHLFEHSLRVQLNVDKPEKKASPEPSASESQMEECDDESEEQLKAFIKNLEEKVECKLLTIDVLKLICNYFLKEDQECGEGEEDLEELLSDEEVAESNMDMEMSKETSKEELKEITLLKTAMKKFNMTGLLVKSVVEESEAIFEDIEKVDHIVNSINLIRLEALNVYSAYVQNFYLEKNESVVDIEILHSLELLRFIKDKAKEELVLSQDTNQFDLLERLINTAHDIYAYFSSKSLDHSIKLSIVELIKEILFKYKTENSDVCVKASRMLTLLAINENEAVPESQALIQTCATILLELTSATFSTLMDQSSIETFVLNAELLDLVVDFFGDDNLTRIEEALNFKERIRGYSEQFYIKYKAFGKTRKLKKDSSLIIRTVKDNFKSFVEYKLKR